MACGGHRRHHPRDHRTAIRPQRGGRAARLADQNAPEAREKTHVRHFLTSIDPGENQRIPTAVRSHWSVENLNHHKRDTCLWREDDHRHRRVNIAQHLALTRNALLAIIPFGADEPLSRWFENYQRHPAKAIQLILHATHPSNDISNQMPCQPPILKGLPQANDLISSHL